jgi:type I restriction enzyme S subunit
MSYSRKKLGQVIAEAGAGFASGERDPKGIVQLRMNNVGRNGELVWDSFLRVPADDETRKFYELRAGDVLFNNTNSTELVGKTALFVGHPEPVVFSNHFTRIRTKPDTVEPGYLSRWLNFQWCSKVFENLCNRWVGQSAVGLDALLALEVPLPPLARQREIVALLDAQLAAAARARAAVAAQLAEAEKLLSAFLAQTFSSIQASDRATLIDLVASPLRTGTSKPAMSGSAFRCLTLSAVRHGALDFEASKPVDLTPEESAKSQVRSGAFYVVRGNGNKSLVGRGALAPVTPPANMAFPDLLFEVQPDATKLRPDFLRWAWDSSEVREQIEDAAATAAGIYKINQRNLGAVTLPVPTLAKQEEIAARLNQESAASRALIGHLTARLAELDPLPGALLRAAFTF